MTTKIRSKFRCHTVARVDHGGDNETEVVELTATGDQPWAKYTPMGEVKLHIDNPSAQGVIKPGMHFYVDLVPVDDDDD